MLGWVACHPAVQTSLQLVFRNCGHLNWNRQCLPSQLLVDIDAMTGWLNHCLQSPDSIKRSFGAKLLWVTLEGGLKNVKMAWWHQFPPPRHIFANHLGRGPHESCSSGPGMRLQGGYFCKDLGYQIKKTSGITKQQCAVLIIHRCLSLVIQQPSSGTMEDDGLLSVKRASCDCTHKEFGALNDFAHKCRIPWQGKGRTNLKLLLKFFHSLGVVSKDCCPSIFTVLSRVFDRSRWSRWSRSCWDSGSPMCGIKLFQNLLPLRRPEWVLQVLLPQIAWDDQRILNKLAHS